MSIDAVGAMTLWVRTRRVLLLALVLVAVVAVGLEAGTRSVVLPVVFGSVAGRSALTSFVPLFWGLAVADAFAPRRSSIEARPAGVVVHLDVALLFLLSTISGSVVFQFLNPTGIPGFGFGSMAVASGLACGVTLRSGPGSGAFAVSALVLVTAVYGTDAPAARLVRVFEPTAPLWWSVGCGLVLLGWSSWLLIAQRVRTEFRPFDAFE